MDIKLSILVISAILTGLVWQCGAYCEPCWTIHPEDEREECGYPGITEAECGSRGCCFDDHLPGTYWCFLRVPWYLASLPSAEACQAGLDDHDSRVDCGWEGISKDNCECRGCCFDDSTWGKIYCYKSV